MTPTPEPWFYRRAWALGLWVWPANTEGLLWWIWSGIAAVVAFMALSVLGSFTLGFLGAGAVGLVSHGVTLLKSEAARPTTTRGRAPDHTSPP